MTNQSKKRKLRKKLAEFQLNGLKSYRKYINRELDRTPKTKLKRAYRSYLQKEHKKCTTKIKKIREKL